MGKLQQVRTALTASIACVIVGMLIVWPSYTLDLYTLNTTVLYRPMTEVESSLVGSAPALGSVVGCVVISMVVDKIGCQKSGLIGIVPLTISWITISLTKSPTVIIVARIMAGISSGTTFITTPMLISGIAEDSIRGMLCSIPMLCSTLGLIISYLLGWFLTYKHVIWINIAVCFTYIALMMTITETPIYLLRRNRKEDAAKSIAYYRSVSVSSKVVFEEISRLKQQINPAVHLLAPDESQAEKEEVVQKARIPPYKLLFLSPSSRRALIVVAVLMVLQGLMGLTAVQVYANEIFRHSAPNLSSNFCSVMLAVVLLMGNITTATLTDKYGRRILLMTSSLLTAICLILMGVQLQTSIAPSWVSVVLIMAYSFVFISGAGSMPFLLATEVFTPEVQSLASMIEILLMWLIYFLILYTFPFMVKYLGIYGTFYTFAVVAVMNMLVGFLWLPETKGLTNEQIQEEFLRTVKINKKRNTENINDKI